ncbi:WAT1-RELATED PROTEIN [Salix koriyanagi]|uniref:WAT1-related protein n=1 Tax=Salix koriyanagi TaxID=2511006 RepID=A0A9Q0W6W2_9ROSI|nr:WAT1-RELATED PROTEIN [Salix koriyanagi]
MSGKKALFGCAFSAINLWRHVLAIQGCFQWWKNRPTLSFVTFWKIFFLSLFGITLSLDVFGIGIVYASATLAAAISNSLPVVTFFLALLLRMEVLKLRSLSGIAKIVGIIACIAGAITLALYKGPHFNLFCLHHLFESNNSQGIISHVPSGQTRIKGCFPLVRVQHLMGLMARVAGKGSEKLPIKASIHNSSVLSKLNSIILPLPLALKEILVSGSWAGMLDFLLLLTVELW